MYHHGWPISLFLPLFPYLQNGDNSCFLVSNTVKNQVSNVFESDLKIESAI